MLTGRCHCGKVGWRFDGMPRSATACNCTVCRRYGTLWAYDWLGERITTEGATEVYLRGERWLGFHFCSDCAAVMWWQGVAPDEAGRTRIAVNLRTIEEPETIAAIPIRHFDGLDAFAALPNDQRTVKDMWF